MKKWHVAFPFGCRNREYKFLLFKLLPSTGFTPYYIPKMIFTVSYLSENILFTLCIAFITLCTHAFANVFQNLNKWNLKTRYKFIPNNFFKIFKTNLSNQLLYSNLDHFHA